MSRQILGILVLLVLLVVLLLGMRAGWLRRGRTTAVGLGTLPAVPAAQDRGRSLSEPIRATYVATTFGGQRLERVVAHQLGVKAPAILQVHEAGVEIARTGATDVFIPVADLRDVGRATGMVGKFVSPDGLVVLTWVLGEQTLDTGLRARHSEDSDILTRAVAGLIAARKDTP